MPETRLDIIIGAVMDKAPELKALREELQGAGIDATNLRSSIDDWIRTLQAASPESAEYARRVQEITQAFQNGEISAEDAREKLEEIRHEMQKGEEQASGFKVSLTDIWSGVQMGTQAVEKVIQAFDQFQELTVDKYLNLVNQVRTSSAAWGTTYEDTSRTIEVFGDLGVTYEQLSASMDIATKNGLQPTAENLANLADEALAIQDPTERAAFLARTFGRSWADIWPVLEQGGAHFLAMTEGVAGVKVVTEEAVKQSLEYKQALDNLNDAVDEVEMSVGQDLVPVEISAAQGLADLWNNTEGWSKAMWAIPIYGQIKLVADYTATLTQNKIAVDEAAAAETANADANQYAAEQIAYYLENAEETYDARDYMIQQTEELTDVEEEEAAALEKLAEAQKALLQAGLDGQLQELNRSYGESMAELVTEQETLTAEIEKAIKQGYEPAGRKITELNTALEENAIKQQDLKDATAAATAEILFQQVAASMDTDAALLLARQMGLISKLDYQVATTTQTLTEQYDLNKDGMINAGREAHGFNEAMLDLNEALADGKLTAEELNDILAGMDGQTYHADFTYSFSSTGTPPPVGASMSSTYQNAGGDVEEFEAAGGFHGWADGPIHILAGEAGRERIDIWPESETSNYGSGSSSMGSAPAPVGVGDTIGPIYINIDSAGKDGAQLVQEMVFELERLKTDRGQAGGRYSEG